MHNDAPRFDPRTGKQLPKHVTYNKVGPTGVRGEPYRMRFPMTLVRELGGTRAANYSFPTLDALLESNEFRTLSAHVEAQKAKAGMGVRRKKRTGGVRTEAAKRRSEEEYCALIARGTTFHPDIVWQPKNKSWLVNRNFGTGWRWRGTAYSYEDGLLLHKGCMNLRGPADVIGLYPNAPRKRRMHARDLIRRLHRERRTMGSAQDPRWDNVPEVRTSMLERCDDYVDEEAEEEAEEEDDDDDDGVEEEEGEEETVLEGVVVQEGEWDEEGAAVTVEAEAEAWEEEWDKRSTATTATAAAPAAASDVIWPSCSGRVSKQTARYDGQVEDCQQRCYNIQNRKKHVQGSYQTAGIYFVHMKLRGVHGSVQKARAKFAPLVAFRTNSLLDEAWGQPA